jgi:hypothetical protein
MEQNLRSFLATQQTCQPCPSCDPESPLLSRQFGNMFDDLGLTRNNMVEELQPEPYNPSAQGTMPYKSKKSNNLNTRQVSISQVLEYESIINNKIRELTMNNLNFNPNTKFLPGHYTNFVS